MSLAREFNALFHGLERAHGTYTVQENIPQGEKQQGTARTLQSPVTDAIWEKHLDGTTRIGIIPINDDNQCYFGAIDIDVYPLDLVEQAKLIESLKLPLVPCRSKSGGLHAYIFFSEPISAAVVQGRLREYASLLGRGSSEIFPKQTKIVREEGNFGNWINMPYFNAEETACYGLSPSGEILSAIDFLAYATSKQIKNILDVKAIEVTENKDFKGAPPCLAHLAKTGFPTGQRNDSLFNIATFLHKRDPKNWEKELYEYNDKYCNPPLPKDEVRTIGQSATHKKYIYGCKRPPISLHCNAGLCRTKEYGQASLTGAPVMTNLQKYDTEPPRWYADMAGGGRLKLTTEQMQNQSLFQKACIEQLNTMPTPVNNIQWQSMLEALLGGVTIIEAPYEATPEGILMEQIEKFCTNKFNAKTAAEIKGGKVWTEEGLHYFKLSSLMLFLKNNNFKEYKEPVVCSVLHKAGGETKFFNFSRQGVTCWKVPEFKTNHDPLQMPEMKPKESF